MLFFLSLKRGWGNAFESFSFGLWLLSFEGNTVGCMSLALNRCSREILLLLKWLSFSDFLSDDLDTDLAFLGLGDDSLFEPSREDDEEISEAFEEEDPDDELEEKSDEGKSEVGELLQRLWSNVNLDSGVLEML